MALPHKGAGVARGASKLLLAGALAAAVGCEEAPAGIEGPYVPPQVKGWDGRRLLWKPKPGEKKCYEPDFSPDGTKVVVSYRDGIFGFDGDLAALDLNTKEFKIILEGNYATRPQWSPDGKWIVYECKNPAPNGRKIWLVRADGSDNQKLELGINEVYVPYWGPKGDKIYFVGHYVPGEPLYALWYDLRTKEIGVLRKPEELSHNAAIPSPRGENVALGLMETHGRHGHVVLALVDADGSGFRVLWSELNEYARGVGNPRDWSPDGKYVLIRYEPPHGTGTSLWTYELKTAAVRQLTMCPPDEDLDIVPRGSWGPNGEIVFGTEWGWLYLIKAPE